ncbi:hypothetical protein [Mesorhizobium sp.]|uniref:hypothetical protein n=1 Tax=Mesorhizobium sp. TaxID=1871066 RepID=UPI0025FB1946|nr:hypothetical protein [Mesorhizobium sp.]
MQFRRAFKRDVAFLRTPGIGKVEFGRRNQFVPVLHHRLQLVRRRHDIFAARVGRPIAAAKGLMDRDDLADRDARLHRSSHGSVDHVVVDGVCAGAHRISAYAKQIDMRVVIVVGVGKIRVFGRPHVHRGDEGLGVWHASVDPVGFGFQILSVYLCVVLAGGIRLVDEKKPIHLGIAKEGGDFVDKGLGHALALVEPDHSLHAIRQLVDLLDGLNVDQIETGACDFCGGPTCCEMKCH